MEAASWEIGESGSEQLFTRRAKHVDPEFDITAMVDLVFMMNIYFLVTYVLVSAAGVNLPPAVHCSPLDPETAVVVTVTRSPDAKSIVLYLADNAKGAALRDRAEQDAGLQSYIAQGTSRGKKALLIKAEKNVRLGDMYRIATAATNEGLSLHVAVLEKANP